MSPWRYQTRRRFQHGSMHMKASPRCCSSRQTRYAKCPTPTKKVNTRSRKPSSCQNYETIQVLHGSLDNLKPEGAYADRAKAHALESGPTHDVHLEIEQPDPSAASGTSNSDIGLNLLKSNRSNACHRLDFGNFLEWSIFQPESNYGFCNNRSNTSKSF